MNGRITFAESCSTGDYDHWEYLGLNLLDKRISWTVDLNGAGCGCNVAFYMTSLKQNEDPSTCEDYYCDANAVCGVRCTEIDMQEANTHAWFSTLHLGDDMDGSVIGYGGDMGKPDYRDFGKDDYAPGSWCIDTNRPFRVTVSFHTEGTDLLKGMELYINQEGSDCSISKTNRDYPPTSEYHPFETGRNAFAELTDAMNAGMTPIISYWSDPNMWWMDGPGKDGQGPCEKGADKPEETCPDEVKFSDFKIEPIY
jgi:hypothetical protein